MACDKFILDRWTLRAPQRLPRDDRFHILAVVEGRRHDVRSRITSNRCIVVIHMLIPAASRAIVTIDGAGQGDRVGYVSALVLQREPRLAIGGQTIPL